jgi:L-threonylcarbamoyladenylate synthase
MRTRCLHVPDEGPDRARAIELAARILREGGLVAFPTETVYGLGANALDAAAVARVFEAKGRPAWDPLIVHVTSREMLGRVTASLPAGFGRLVERFMPGPLTVLAPKSDAIPGIVTAGRPQVAVRMPSHPVARALIERAGVPVAAPSANRFGHASPTRAQHVIDDLDGRIDAVLDGGATRVGVESTVVDITTNPPLVLRPGGVSREALEAVLGSVEVYRAPAVEVPAEALPSPGAGIRHYAPRARLLLVDRPSQVRAEVEGLLEEGLHVGVLDVRGGGRDPGATWPAQVTAVAWGTWGEWDGLARGLFDGLRSLDACGVDAIVCPLPPEEGLGLALRDRLTKAARQG